MTEKQEIQQFSETQKETPPLMQDIKLAEIKQENIKTFQPGTTTEECMLTLANDKNHLIFNPGHSLELYQKGLGWINNDVIYEAVIPGKAEKDQPNRIRFIVINAESLASNPLFKVTSQRQEVILEAIVKELRVSYLSIFKEGLKDLETTSGMEEVINKLKSNIPKSAKIRNEAIKYFLDASKREGVSLEKIKFFDEINSEVIENIQLLNDLEAN